MSLHPFLAELAAAGLYTPPPGRGGTNGATNGHYTGPAGPPPNPDDPTNQRYAHTALVSECTQIASTPEGGRNHALNAGAYSLGQLVAGGYLVEADTRAALLDAGAACGLPPIEVARTVESGLRAGLAVPRVVALRAVPQTYTMDGPGLGPDGPGVGSGPGQVGPDGPGPSQDQPGPGEEPGAHLPPYIDWEQAWAGVSDEVDWLIPDVLERGRSHVLYAPAKVGKSLYVQWMAGLLASRGVRVAYIDCENSLADIVERLKAMGHRPETLSNLRYFSFPSLSMLDTPAGGAQLFDLVTHHESELVVLDTTSRVVGGEENDSTTFRALYRYALMPLKARGVTTLRIDHAGKDPTAGQRGSSAKQDDVDVVWLMVRHGDDHYTLRCDVQRSGHHPLTIGLVKRTAPLRFDRTDAEELPPAVAALVADMDRLCIPVDMPRRAAYAELAKAGIRAGNTPLMEAVRYRRNRSTSWESWSGTKLADVDLHKINNSGPEDQTELPICPGEVGPGPSQDHQDHDPGRRGSRLVPDRTVPSRGPSGTNGTTPVPDRPSQDRFGPSPAQPGGALVCDRCRLPAERLIPSTRGQRICPVCAYPDPATRPGAATVELESE